MKKPSNIVDKRQHDILVDTVRNPNKAFLGGPSVDDAKKTLKSKFGYTDQEIKKLEESKILSKKELVENKIRKMVKQVLNEDENQIVGLGHHSSTKTYPVEFASTTVEIHSMDFKQFLQILKRNNVKYDIGLPF